MRTNSIKYNALLAMAHGDTPMTAREVWDEMDEEQRPQEATADDDEVWSNLTSHLSKLYGEHYADRRKRPVKFKPFEYWIAGRGEKALRSNGDLPDGWSSDAPVAENIPEGPQQETEVDPGGEPETVTCEACGSVLEVGPETHPPHALAGHKANCDGERDGDVNEPDDDERLVGGATDLTDPGAVAACLGLNDPDVNSGEALSGVLAGVVSTLRETERAVDDLRDDAETDSGGTDSSPGGASAELLGEVEDLREQVRALSTQLQQSGAGTPFWPYIRRLRQLDDEGYGLYEGEITTGFGGNVVEVRVKAKPADKCASKGPETDGERSVSSAADTVAENDIDPEYGEADDD